MSSVWCLIVVAIVTIKAEIRSCSGSSGTCTCTSGKRCTLICDGDNACSGSGTTIQCRPSQPCTIICNSGNNTAACKDAHIEGNGATEITIQCVNDTSCQSATIDCGSATQCNIECGGLYACQYTNIDCGTSQCGLNCASQNTCEAMNINTANAMSFNISIPTNQPTAYPSNAPTKSLSPSENPTKYPSNAPTIDPNQRLVVNTPTAPTNAPITHTPTNAPHSDAEGEVGEIQTPQVDTDSGRLDSGNGHDEATKSGVSVYVYTAIICSAVVCCLLIAGVFWVRYRLKKKAREYFIKRTFSSSGNRTMGSPKSPTSNSGHGVTDTPNSTGTPITEHRRGNRKRSATHDSFNNFNCVLQEGDMDIITDMHVTKGGFVDVFTDDDPLDEINNTKLKVNGEDEQVMNEIFNSMATAGNETDIDTDNDSECKQEQLTDEVYNKIDTAAHDGESDNDSDCKDEQVMQDVYNEVVTAGNDMDNDDKVILCEGDMDNDDDMDIVDMVDTIR